MIGSVESIRECLEGLVPSVLGTAAPDGTPNVTFVSQVHYVDAAHVALSFQFFNKTRENILANPQATVQVVHPQTAASYQLRLQYLRTELDGPLFQRMKAALAGIASQAGMTQVFQLRGADVYKVLSIEDVSGATLPGPPRRNLLPALRRVAERVAGCRDLAMLADSTLALIEQEFGITHSMLLIPDAARGRLYTLASRGYPSSGVGSEIPLGRGVMGVAAQFRTPIRIGHLAAEYAYQRAVRAEAEAAGYAAHLGQEIPFPGLPDPHSQLAVPLVVGGQLLGVLAVESGEPGRFGYDDEDALVTLAAQLAVQVQLLQDGADEAGETSPATAAAAPSGPPLSVRHYAEDDSVFLDEEYLIKGVAGAILWKLLRDHVREGRVEFSNRELRLDRSLRLPDVCDNLEARLLLLSRRLAERSRVLALEKCGRGRMRLRVDRPLHLVDL